MKLDGNGNNIRGEEESFPTQYVDSKIVAGITPYCEGLSGQTESPIIEYYTIQYELYDDNENYKENETIWIQNTIINNEESKEIKDSTIKSESQSEEEKIYNSANAAKEKGYYTIAKNLYSEVINYKDSKQNYEDMLNLLKEYDGTYYGESTERKNVYYYIYIQNGEVRGQLSNSTSNIDKYELYVYGKDKDTGTQIMAFSYPQTELFKLLDDITYGDGYAIQELSDGSYLVAATKGSTYYTFNGFYDKISDTVDDKSMFN